MTKIFYEKDANKKIIAENGIKLIGTLYKCRKQFRSLNELRFLNYQAATIKSSFKLENLPPTEDSAKEHCFRAYYQLQTWLGNKLSPTDWGWKEHEKGIMPKFSGKELIPESLLKTISCRCELGCDKRCGCRKHGLECTDLCLNCMESEKCTNIKKKTCEDFGDSEEVEEEPVDVFINNENDDNDLQDLEDSTEIENFISDVEYDEESPSDDEEIPSKKLKLTH